MGELIALTNARRGAAPRTPRELAKLLSRAHAMLDAQPQRYTDRRHVDRSQVMPFEQFQRSPARTSIFGYSL